MAKHRARCRGKVAIGCKKPQRPYVALTNAKEEAQ